MSTASISLNPSFEIGPVRPRTFGSFVEHLGRCVYTGIHEADHPTADEDGFRQDVLELVKELGVTTVRYPGGNFVSGYRWEDGVGPVEDRPKRLDLAWHSMEPNTIGTDEFMRWAAKASIEPIMAVNLGTRGVAEALELLEYCNIADGSTRAEERRANGADKPYGVQLWCLGNEMDGPWQIGHKTPEEYGRLAAETARAMRMIAPDLELIACGSSSRAMPTFGQWEHTVLDESWEHVDMISAHAYYWEKDDDLQSFLCSAVDMDRFIEQVAATADAVGAARKSDKQIGISFDEWNVWYQDRAESRPPTGDDWPIAPVLLEDNYTTADAVVVGNLLISLLRHTDRVWSANLAQLVNVIAPIMTVPGGKAWKQTIFHPFALTARHARGNVLRVSLASPKVSSDQFGTVDAIDSIATLDGKDLSVFLVNRDERREITTEIAIPDSTPTLVEAVTLHSDDPRYQASADDDSTVVPLANSTGTAGPGRMSVTLPPVSWTMLRATIG